MQRLAELRESQALTLRDLGDKSGVDANTINQIELGHRRPRPSTLRKLAKGLGVEVEEILGKAQAQPSEERARAARNAQPVVLTVEWALGVDEQDWPSRVQDEAISYERLRSLQAELVKEIKRLWPPRGVRTAGAEQDARRRAVLWRYQSLSRELMRRRPPRYRVSWYPDGSVEVEFPGGATDELREEVRAKFGEFREKDAELLEIEYA